ncbi:MAG TPA: DUF3857 domain-containing protein, partial [Candidatus Acidoferrales bacterium]|nr:DUF3857 domain-containing protein [Candidatus Acidoferrales bacterium]
LTDAAAGAERPEVYDDARNFSGPLPAVTVGSIVEEEVVVEDTAALFPGAFSRRIYFGHDEPVLRSVLTIDAPTSMALRYSTRLLPDVEIKKAESNGTSSLRFEQGLLKAIHNKDKALPDDVPLWPAVDFSAASSWNAVAAAYYHAVESSLRPADVSVLLEGSKGLSGEALLRRLLTSLHQQVRYTGVEFGISSLIPHSPKETVGRKYGDCKDKAVVLVSLLKAVGIPAQLALLSTRGSDDVNPDLPGLGLFDHAIVYLPGAPGRFIDATAEYLDPGSLPWMDQGRLALVVDPGTTSLLRIPVAAPGNNLLVEKRDFTLAEYGPARIVETSEPRGAMESNYRAAYGETDAKETHEALEKYMKDEYSAEALTSATHAPSTDLTKDFSLRLEAARGKRGYSSLNDAVVVIYPSGIVNQLPAAVQPQGDEEAPSADQAESNKRTHDVFFEQVAIEWRYHIVPPPTFAAQPLPEDRNIPLGPASVTEHFKKEADGSVSAIVRFDSAKPRYTVEELQAFRLADTKLRNSDGILIRFVQEGAALQAEGRVKEALASYASLVALHPAEALHHSQIAYAMLDAGLGQQARDEAKKAVTLDATSPVAFQTQAWILQHDLIGRRFGTGFDLEGAIAAYRKAAELDPKDYATKANLAILLEYDANGNRYSSKAHLGQAVEEYKAVATLDPRRSKEYDDNLLYVLAYSQRWKEAAEKAASLPGNATRQSILAAAAAVEQGPEAGIAEAGRRTSSDADRSGALMNAANLLFKLRMYPQGVALLSASAGQQGSADVRARIQALSNVRPYEQLLLPATNVNRVVQDYFMCLMEAGFTPDKILRIIEFDPGDKKDVAELFSRENVTTRSHFRTQGIPDAVILDTVFSNLKFSVEGDDASGYRVRAQPIGAPPVVFLISHQPGGNRIVSVGDEYFMVGAEVLRRLAAGDTKNAKLWLDWAREGITLQTGDDPLGGSLFARFWTRGDDPDPAKMKLAALAALVDSSQIGEHLGELQ